MSKESTSESLHESKERTIGPLLQELKETETAKEDDLLSNTVTRILYHDYSQLPVLSTEGKYVGFISWKSIVAASRTGKDAFYVKECLDKNMLILRGDEPLLSTVQLIYAHDFALIEPSGEKPYRIITTYDLATTLHDITEPFLILEQIEADIRAILESVASFDEIHAQLPLPKNRTCFADLRFSDYIKFVENYDFWERTRLTIDRPFFTERLDAVRKIRNSIMHFKVFKPEKTDLDELQSMKEFLALLRPDQQD